MSDLKTLNITNFAKGAAVELFERELGQVLENIDDVNTKGDFQREITLKFTIKPDADREEANLAVEAKSKLAPVKHATGQTYLGRRSGKLTAFIQDINQLELNTEAKPEIVRERGHA